MPRNNRSRDVAGEGSQAKEKHGLFLLHPPNDTADAEVDIIAIHGLGGDAFRTWTEDNKKLWLRDFLPDLVPKSRIMTFGYDSNWAFSRSVAGIEEFALDLLNRLRNKRWSVEALILSQEQPFFANIFEKTRGIIFFGTPHRGSRIASWAQLMSNYVNACLFHSPMRAKLLKDLGPNSDALAIISSSFKFVVSKIQIITFYENEIMLPLKGLVVEKESAVLGITNERIIPIAADHRNMVKFTHYASQKFESVRYALQELITGPPVEKVPPEALPYAMEAFTITDYFFHLSSVPTRVLGTCEWVAAHPSFQNWLSTSESDMLWLRGYPGVGKTVLAKYLIESVIPSRRALPNTAIKPTISNETEGDVLTYFFCNDKDMERKLENNILKAILHQLLTLEPSLISALIPRAVLTNWGFVNQTAALWAALEDAILATKNKTIYIVLDALDEMDYGHLESFTAAIGKLAETVGPHIAPRQLKVLVTSRPEPEIEQNLCCASIAVRSERDVRYYVTNLVQKFAVYHAFPPDSTEMIIDTLTLKAGNMFLWASLAWNGFREGVTVWSRLRVEERLQSLELLPVGLEGLYESILSRYNNTMLKQLMNIFSWLIAITRPLTAKEIGFAVAMNEDTTRMKDLDIGFSMETQLNKICPNLLRVNSTGHVQFDHQSFKDFLLSPNTNPRYRINILEAHAKIAICCLRCFTFDDLNAGLIRDRVSNKGLRTDTLTECELLRYASKNWPYHAQTAPRNSRVWDAYQRLSSRRDSLGLWWVLYRYDDRFSRQHMTCYAATLLPLPLHIAVALDIRYFVENFISSGVDINQRESPRHDQKGFFSSGHAGGTVLHFDSINSEMIRFLVANGADISIKNYDGDTPLHSALRRNKEQLCCHLLDCSPADADLNVKDKSGNTLLHMVLDKEFPLVLSMLLDDARVNLADFDAITPLELACTWGNESMVRVLLASDRVIEAQRQKTQRQRALKKDAGISLLFLIILQGWPDLAMRMMEKMPSDFEEELDKNQRTILHHAVMEHWHDILDKYLDRTKPAKLNKMDKNGMTPLHWAAKVRNGYAATRLLDSGAQSGVPDHQGKSPLHTAAEAGSERVLKLLLDRGAVDVTEIDNEKRTVLHYVATWDLALIAQRLVALPEVDVNAKDRYGRTAAHLAAMFGCPAVLGTLLNLNKTDINVRDHSGNTILHCAVDGGSEVCITGLLWRPGLEINIMNRYAKTPLDVTYSSINDVRAKDMRAFLRGNGAKRGLWRPPQMPHAYRSISTPTTEPEKKDRKGWQLACLPIPKPRAEQEPKIEEGLNKPDDSSVYSCP